MKKVLLIVGAVIAVALVSVVWICKANDTKNKNNPIKLGNGSSNKNAIIVYQKGRSSYADKVAQSIGDGLVKDGYNVVLNQPGDYLEKDLSKYDLILFGSPVYAAQTSSQIKKYADSIVNYGNGKVICYCVGNVKDKDESKEFMNSFNGKATGAFKVVKSDFDVDKDVPINKIRSILG
ncbi:MAG TPA: hypothetical protein DG753_09130 [Clostridium sp.]|nr:hypothetical protein [Clostridium sp.]